MINSLELLEKKLISHLKDVKKLKKNAKKSKIEQYFTGQYDALNQVLMELKIVKYEIESSDTAEEAPAAVEAPVAEDVAAPAPTEVPDKKEPPKKSGKAAKKAPKRKKAQPEELSPELLAAKELLEKAVKAGVIEQKISLYRHKAFPDGRLRGRMPVMELLVNEAFANLISEEIAKKQADNDTPAS